MVANGFEILKPLQFIRELLRYPAEPSRLDPNGERPLNYPAAALCIGGGEATAIALEMPG